MEPMVVCAEKRRGRKRKSNEVNSMPVESDGKKRTVETRSAQLVGRYVRKKFEGGGIFLGKIMVYNLGLYRIQYDNGDFEDLNSREVKTFLLEDGALIGEWSERKGKLENLLLLKESNNNDGKVSKVENTVEQESMDQINLPPLDELSNGNTGAREVVKVCDDGTEDDDVDADSSSDACENTREWVASLDMEVPLVPPPELPPSSGNIGVLEEYVSHLLSVHSFLRSFSGQLFLYPFGLDDFVGALNCSAANTLLDSIHVALMRILKRQFEKLSSDGSDIALKCLSFLDWSLLDTLTWPVYLAHYLMVMGYANGSDWKGFYTCCLHGDYYTLSAGKKLVVLQILCDDVLDSEELRAEMDMREESEFGIDIDTCSMVGPTGGPRRVHPRHFKTSACKVKKPIPSMSEHHEMKPFIGSHFAGSEEGGTVGSPIDEDGNGDECRLCGMDGLLLCCDGCPSAYHARCLGLNKMQMSVYSWYCPECKINATEPKILQGTTLRSGRNFGVDPYEQVFIASGDHLLILKTSVKPESSLRYYNRHDIPRVVHALFSKTEHVVMYSGICHEIVNYWELPEVIVPCSGVSEVGLQLANDKGSGESTILPLSLLKKSIPETTEVENSVSCVTSTNASDVASILMDCSGEPARSGNSSDTVSKSGQLGNIDYSAKHSSLPVNGTPLEDKLFLPRVDFNGGVNRKADGNSYNGCFYMGSSFKTKVYINHYLHGDFAASAAASLAILSSEENQCSKSHASDNRKKVLSASISLQVKAFSSAASRFFWPNTERKLVEVPRERCSWCFSCTAPVTSKKGCLLNAAASNATRGAIKVLAGVRPTKNGDGRLLGISTYIMFIEESISGLLVGPFLNATFRTRWRKQVEQAATCHALKILLLELEENIRTIALAGDWTKPVGGSTQSSDSQIAAHTSGSTQKHRSGRRGRKPSVAVEVAVDDSNTLLTGFTWWRGDKLSKLMSRRGALPYSIIRKAARHGSSKKIPGIHYVEENETPKTSRQLIWRSAVETSRNIAQLALQVRYLDFYMRWSDFVRPEQTPPDKKSSETEATAFRNAFICHKKNLGNEIRYCVAFRNQKHLPSRILKSVAEVEQPRDDGQERYWFCETHIPLYLIKQYEEKLKKDNPVDVLSKLQRRLRRRQLKASRKNIFLYLLRKQDNTAPSYCCSCQQNVLCRDAVKCSACQGSCHTQCATSSTVHMNEEVEFLVTCKQCSESRAMTQVESCNGSPASSLFLQVQDFPNAASEIPGKIVLKLKGSSASVKNGHLSSLVKTTNSSASANKSKKNQHWGLRWRKENAEDTGIDFRLKNILHKGNPDNLIKPSCRLCKKPYNADLTYIYCETCQYWFHADALEFDESKLFSLVGFKCCLCRRIKSPECPYVDPEKKVLKDKIERKRRPNMEVLQMHSDSGSISKYHNEDLPVYSVSPKAEVIYAVAEDPLLSEFDKWAEYNSVVNYGLNDATLSVQVAQKLTVRRHVEQEKSADSFQVEISSPFESNLSNSTEKLPVRRHFQIEASNTSEVNNLKSEPDSLSPKIQWDNFNDGIILDYDSVGFDDMEFEPQTYFSFNDLLDFNDAGNESSGNVIKDWENSSELQENGPLELLSVQTILENVACNICSHTEPRPDFLCEVCSKSIHKYCSPWIESSTQGEASWKCGNCREWR